LKSIGFSRSCAQREKPPEGLIPIVAPKAKKRNDSPHRNGCRNDSRTVAGYDVGVLKLRCGEGIMPGGKPMVRTEKTAGERQRTAGDAAVDGLLAGAAAGIVMTVYLVVMGLLAGEGPAVVLARFDPSGPSAASPLLGAVLHLAVSAVYGLLFGLIYRLIGRGHLAGRAAGALMGLVYGLALLLVAQGLTAVYAGAALREIPALHFALAHLIYGLVLGWLVARR
jgi:hypothetical protein